MSPSENIRGDVWQAYKKLLASVYYDKSNTNLILRRKIAQFYDQEKRIKMLGKVQDLLSGDLKLEELDGKISYVILPKGVKKQDIDDEIVTNDRKRESNVIPRFNLFIDGPIEVYVLSVLWLMKIGYKLDKDLSDQCYGNRFLINDEKSAIVSGRGLFKHYVHQYQKWRDDGVKKAKEHLEGGSDIGFVNLDITSFYYHVRFDWSDIQVASGEKETSILNELIKEVYQKYTELVIQDFKEEGVFELGEEFDVDENGTPQKVILPIGLPSSYTLANFYLKEFDKQVENKVKPLFYGRYVDDIVLVISKPDFSEDIDSSDIADQIILDDKVSPEDYDLTDLPASTKFIGKNLPDLLKTKLMRSEEEESQKPRKPKTSNFDFYLKTKNENLLYVQNKKVMIYEYKAGQSLAAIEKLKHDLQEHSSEFRFLPDVEGPVFDVNAYELQYDGSKGKPRTLKDYKENRYGLSSYLHKRTAVSVWLEKSDVKDEAQSILRFFKGTNIIDYFQQWERLFTYLVVNERKQEIIELLKESLKEIDKCTYKQRENQDHIISLGLKNTLIWYLLFSFSQALTLKPNLFKQDEWLRKQVKFLTHRLEVESVYRALQDTQYILLLPSVLDFVDKTIISLRNSFLVRHYLTTHPLIEFTSYAQRNSLDELPSLIRSGLDFESLETDSFDISDDTLFPGYIKFYKVCIYLLFRQIIRSKENEEINTDDFDAPQFLENAFDLYANFNNIEDDREKEKKKYFDYRCRDQELKIHDGEQSKLITEIKINDVDVPEDQIEIGLANMSVDWTNQALNSLKGRPVMNPSRLERLTEILNKFEEDSPEGDLCVLPEISVPHSLFYWTCSFGVQHKKGIIFGLEHFNTGKKGYNFIVSCLPIGEKDKNDAVVLPRIKNHYSPEEEFTIKNYHLNCIKPNTEQYHLFHWKGFYFTTFYCFELADIEHRSWFRSKIDFMAAPEFNRDVNYFSNIVESTARDLNTYVVQVNTSKYGDSRITRPTKTEMRNLVNIKGGDNDIVIIGTIDIKGFRKFQEKGFGLQDRNKIYKPSPPNFEVGYVKKRIGNEWLFDKESNCDKYIGDDERD